MKQICLFIAIVFALCCFEQGCNNKPHVKKPIQYQIGAGIFHSDTSQNMRMDSVLLVIIDTLAPSPDDSEKNIWQLDSFYQYIDAVKTGKKQNGQDSILKISKFIPKQWMRAFVGPKYYKH